MDILKSCMNWCKEVFLRVVWSFGNKIHSIKDGNLGADEGAVDNGVRMFLPSMPGSCPHFFSIERLKVFDDSLIHWLDE